MFRLIAAIVMIMMPVISVSNGGPERQDPFGTRDLADEEGCYKGQPDCGPPPPFTTGTTIDR
ncbi:MAG: hypothetical protein OES32_07855 [Acidobacteriota bacterium]|nr:hypothetical protein [Acidobacteriota bacterium]MDH3523488.1 hypothetical protein [Acidobacteriota bacterium]